jgi:CDP-diacylglycerol--glycerol-3-phosphate 3-phosphatidyltransferase
MLQAEGGHSWAAGIIFGAAGITDQVDGFLARRWHAESSFGKVADPLADRLMIDAAVVLLWLDDRLPLIALGLILARDLVLLAGYRLLSPRGYQLDVNLLGKVATWVLYASLAMMIVTPAGTDWPLWLFWIGLAMAVVAGAGYVAGAYRALRSPA